MGIPGDRKDAALHPLLTRQLTRLALDPTTPPDGTRWETLVARVSAAYAEAEQHRYLVERSLEVSSNEMRTLYEELSGSQARLEAVFDSASVGLCVVDADGLIEAVNPAAEAVLGRTEESLLRVPLWAAVTISAERSPGHPFDDEAYAAALASSTPWREDDAVVTCGARSFLAACILTPLLSESGRRAGAVLVLRDVTDHKRAQAALSWQASHDTLTGLPNRAKVMSLLQAALTHARTKPGKVCVLFIDLDRFKAVNDSLGHAVGDALLTQVVKRVSDTVRGSDVVGRLAGDEFVVLCDRIELEDAQRIAQRVVGELEKPFLIDGNEVLVSGSVGLAVDTPGSTAASLLGEADQAMYQAKQSGRSCVRVFDDSLRVATQHRMHLESSLRRAVRDHDLEAVFQPQVAMADGSIVGFELLARWNLDGAAVPPALFIPMAEELGLIHELGAFVLERAADSLRDWAAAVPGVRLSVNVSGRQLQNRSFVEHLSRLVRTSGIDPEGITLEVTESVLLDDPAAAIAVLHRLRDLGFGLSVDDFGTGYSSLSYLRQLPVHEVKIDRGFVSDLTSSEQGRVIVDAVVRLCHALGARVVAEGVETEDQAAVLREMGCDVAQGWLFGRPGTEDQARVLLGLAPASAVR